MGVVVRNLYNIDGRWKYRKVIPVKLRAHVDGNLTEFVRWLGSGSQSDPDVLRRYALAAEECGTLIALAKKRDTGAFDDLSAEMIAHIIETARHNELDEDESDRFDDDADAVFENVSEQLKDIPGVLINADPDRRWNKRQESLEAFLVGLRHNFARGRVDETYHWELTDLCVSHGLHVDRDGLGFRRLGKAYLAMMIEVTEARLKRQRGEVVSTPAPPAAKSASEVDAPVLTIRETAEKKLAMKQKGYATTEATETALRLFEGVYEQKPMASITRKDVAEWVFLLQQKPRQPSKEHRALSLRDLVVQYKGRDDFERVTGKSVNGHVSHLNSVWNWARARGFVDRSLDNPFSEQRVDETPITPDEGFNPTELQAIFKLPIFTTGERPLGGRGEAAFWLPLLLLTYGTRPEEMCQLLVEDVFYDEEDELWCLRVTDEGSHPVKGSRHIKTDGNALVRRLLPVTKQLTQLGLIEYVSCLKRSGETALFPELTTKGKRGYLFAGFADWWGKYARTHGAIPQSGNKPLRDFRSTWTTAASRSGLTEEDVNGFRATILPKHNRQIEDTALATSATRLRQSSFGDWICRTYQLPSTQNVSYELAGGRHVDLRVRFLNFSLQEIARSLSYHRA